MNPSAREDYLVSEVMTAAPQKLQLMLIDAAIRQANKARALWKDRQDLAASEALVRAQEIVTQLISGVKPDADAQLARQVIGVYGFVFRTLVAAQLEHDDKKLGQAVSILEIDRETWRQLCQKLGSSASPAAAGMDMPTSSGTSFVA